MKFILLLAAAISAPPENAKECLIADTHYYTIADIEQFPAKVDGEVDFKASQEIAKEGGIVFEILIDRCSKRMTGLIKFKAGKPVYGYYYKYKDGELFRLDLRYINGKATSDEIMSQI